MPLSLYDEKSLEELRTRQINEAFDFEKGLPWSQAIDLNKPLVPLDQDALFFPEATPEERLTISQFLGLIIAASIVEMEDCLGRLKPLCFDKMIEEFPVSPEFNALGERFFEEEKKHSQAFKTYIEKYSQSVDVDMNDLLGILPRIENTTTENILKKNLRSGGVSFWWIVASVEQQFLLLHHVMRPFKSLLEPLYFQIHEKHFEEEARHAPFPFLILELLMTRRTDSLKRLFHHKTDLIVAQFLQTFWTISSLKRGQQAKVLRSKNLFFKKISKILPLLESKPVYEILWKTMVTSPYVSTLVNLRCHPKIIRLADRMGVGRIPFPKPETEKLVDY